MMGSAPECAACFMGCASKTGAEKTACGKACGPAAAPSAPPPAPPPADDVTAVESAPSGPCTQQQLMSVATATDPTSAVVGMTGSAPECAACFMGCASKTGAEKTACGKACGPAAAPSTPANSLADTSSPPPAAAAPPPAESKKKCEDSSDDIVNAVSGGLLPNCEAGKALCSADPRIPLGCPLSCGVCKPEKPECKDSPDEVVNVVSGMHPSGVFFLMVCNVGLR